MSDRRSPEVSLTGLTVLLLEDDPVICLDLESSLQDLGATMLSSTHAQGALDLLQGALPDIAVLDFELNPGTSEPVAAFAQAHGIPFLFLSGYGEHDARFLRWADVPVLVKPISINALAQEIERIVRREAT